MSSMTITEITESQKESLVWICKLGTGVKISSATGRALVRRGLAEERGGPDSMLGRTAFVATPAGRELAADGH
jgi:hypothetical protein